MKTSPVVWLAAAAFICSGCYTYNPRPTDEVRPNSEVRARVSAEESGRLSDLLGADLGRTLTGTFVEWSADDRALFEVRQPGTTQRVFQRVDVPRGQVVELEVREFDRTKTALMAIPLIGLLSWLVADQFLEDANKQGPEEPPIDNDLRIPIPLIRIVW